MLQLNKMSFFKSYYYFVKDYDSKYKYLKNDCNSNAYLKFYDNNALEVDKRPKDFVYVTGLLASTINGKKICIKHSWIEDNGVIIDPTTIANSTLNKPSHLNTEEEKKNIENLIYEHYFYIPYFKLKNLDFTKIVQELHYKYGDELFIKEVNKYLISICEKLENDKDFITRVQNKYGFKFVKEGFVALIE